MTGLLIAIAVFAWVLLSAAVSAVAWVYGFSATEFFIYSLVALPITSVFVVHVAASRSKNPSRKPARNETVPRRGFGSVRGFTVLIVGMISVTALFAFGSSPGRLLSYFEKTASAAIFIDQCTNRTDRHFFECLPKDKPAFEWMDTVKEPVLTASYTTGSEDTAEASDVSFAAPVEKMSDTTAAAPGQKPSVPETASVPTRATEETFTPGQVRIAQRLLRNLGFDPGPADGLQGPRTRKAVRAFQHQNGMEPDGQISKDLLQRMKASFGSLVAEDRARSSEQKDRPAVRSASVTTPPPPARPAETSKKRKPRQLATGGTGPISLIRR